VFYELDFLAERETCMYEKKQPVFKSPDLTKMQLVAIDQRTKIYIALDADPDEARKRYQERFAYPKKF
jgi:putative ubiquitin-RnfH superfamily antitoxin RatB of RatAB toxin-antitoxin module